jgi:hypothetical protein
LGGREKWRGSTGAQPVHGVEATEKAHRPVLRLPAAGFFGGQEKWRGSTGSQPVHGVEATENAHRLRAWATTSGGGFFLGGQEKWRGSTGAQPVHGVEATENAHRLRAWATTSGDARRVGQGKLGVGGECGMVCSSG